MLITIPLNINGQLSFNKSTAVDLLNFKCLILNVEFLR
ncbi:hypothetical protein BAZSYMB_SCAFFOLD00092_0 [Bathymodiolus azoricus thioautotrophic gill symbiont]|uniref:Uncharacterized protein n=1 Tax=Bathymodiolus azoricus thioautotrophic gill symbiont TaxID=235205 RepID=A0A1H6M0R3_9GAMM|nr:hypothetical protein BAZSYMB_SCAFFOLD00092_0 [Bathymodiolus azoricus thioautotrophic gill symbiont]